MLEKSFSKESAIFCTVANWASISVRWEENQAVDSLDEVLGGATLWFLIALQISEFISSVVTLSESLLGSTWWSDRNSLATPREQKKRNTLISAQIGLSSLWRVQQTVVVFTRNTCVSGGLLEISWNGKGGLRLRCGSCTLNNRCCEHM